MRNADRVWKILDRVRELSGWKIDQLRTHLAGFGCSEPPTRFEVETLTAMKSRGDLIVEILSFEFDAETNTLEGWGGEVYES